MVCKGLSRPKDKMNYSQCPCCGRKGLYHLKNQHKERCRYCGLQRILLPGQDF